MPPKKRSSTRRAGASVARPTGKQPYILNAAAPAPALPDIPAKNSFAYGSSTTAILPRKLTVQPKRGLAEIAKTIEEGVKEAEDRANESAPNPRPQPQPKSPSPSPVRRSMREPTPDQQLFDSLRSATQSPRFPDDAQSGSTPTPTPPIPHTLSTASSPVTQNFARPADTLYPSPLMRYGTAPPNTNGLSSPQFQSSLDNESVISFRVERDVHEDNLQRTRGNNFRDELHGQNISAPPRRFSGLAFANEVIQEEDEPPTRLSLSKSRSPEVVPQLKPEPPSDPAPEPEPEPEPVQEPEPVPLPANQPETQPQNWAAAKTIIPDRIVRSLSRDPSIQSSSKRGSSYRQTMSPPPPPSPPQRSDRYEVPIPFLDGWSLNVPKVAVRTAVVLFLTAISILTIMNSACCVGWRNPFAVSPFIPGNGTSSDSVRVLTNQVLRLGNEVSSLSKEMQMMKSEAPQPTTIIERVNKPEHQHQESARTNFFSYGMGAIIDPHKTSPTYLMKPGYFQKISAMIMKSRYGKSSPALQALLPWEDVGDCWCGALRADGMSQLGVTLGRPAVPQEVVVEHIPRGASVAPEVAPKEMELWAQFVFLEGEHAPNTFLSREGDTLLANGRTLHENLMEPLRFAYRNEPDSAFSDDPLLGPSFYRIARWTYNIDAPNNVQRYTLDATVDIAGVRVDQVVIRMKSNWGSKDTTCLYRVRLHGHL